MVCALLERPTSGSTLWNATAVQVSVVVDSEDKVVVDGVVVVEDEGVVNEVDVVENEVMGA